LTGDLVVAEVLQGFNSDREFQFGYDLFRSVNVVHLCGFELAVQAADNFRKLRRVGITVRKTVDTLIATYCIVHGHDLLYSDRDFDPFIKHLNLRSAMGGLDPGRLRGP
jgi:predicted nucleic acid-binding protein